jgi:outer membrane cobalamin receptor
MLSIKKSSIIILLISLLIVFLSMLSAQENQKEKQEVTEEFFYAEEEVEIASLKAQPVEEAPGIVSVITSQQIKDMGARDLNDVLKTVPGFQLPIVPAYFVTTYGVRGLQQSFNNRVLVMLDGVPLNEAYYGQSNLTWSTMPINNIKRIEVIRGPGSALYGTYAFLAVINIITNKAEDINGIEISAGGGSWNTQHHYILAGKKMGDFSFSASVDYRKTDGYDDYSIQSDSMTLLYSYVPFLPSVSMAPGKIQVPLHSKLFNASIGYKNFEFQFKVFDLDKGAPLVAYSITDGFSRKDKSYISQIIYRKEVGDKLSILLKGNYYGRKERGYGQAWPCGIYGPLLPLGAQGFFSNGILGDLKIEERNLGLQYKFDYALSEKNVITFGGEFTNLKTNKPVAILNVDPTTRMQSSQYYELSGSLLGFMERAADRNVFAAFVQDSFHIGESLSITAGLRLDHYSDFGSSVNPRLSLVWKFLQNTNIKILYGHAFRAPTFTELYAVYSAQVGNENLGPEKVDTFEIGLNHKFTPNINASVNYFYNDLSDLILPTGKIIIEGWPGQLENSGKIHSQGFEAEVKADFEKNTYAYFNYSYAKAKDELTGEAIPNVANNLFNFGLNIGMFEYLNANLNVNYVGERKRGLLMGFPDPRDPIVAYSLFDLTLRAQNFWQNTEFILSIHNLLDTQYTDPEELGVIYYDIPREGRQIMGKVIFKF